jgi:hypothetical protein
MRRLKKVSARSSFIGVEAGARTLELARQAVTAFLRKPLSTVLECSDRKPPEAGAIPAASMQSNPPLRAKPTPHNSKEVRIALRDPIAS